MRIKSGTSTDLLETITRETLQFYNKVDDDSSSIISGINGFADYAVLGENTKILFQGDSVTDCDRDRNNLNPNDPKALGDGYPYIISDYLINKFPGRQFQFYNRAVGGDKVFQMADRWERDTMSLKPDVLSILIGVNDYWHTISKNYPGALETYEKDYRELLDKTRLMLPNVTLIIGEPFASKEGSATNIETGWDWDFNKFQRYQEIAREIARDYDAAFIPYQSIFDEAVTQKPITHWSVDGVHPTVEGSKLMALAWLSAVKMIEHGND